MSINITSKSSKSGGESRANADSQWLPMTFASYRGDVVEDAVGLLPAAAVERAEDHLHQVFGVCAPLFSQPHHHPLQQELHCWVFHHPLIPLLIFFGHFVIQFN